MKKLLKTICAAMIGFAATVNATEINLRDWLTSKGVTVSDCVSGIGHNSEFGPQKLFDGLGMDGKQNTSLRWLAMYSFASNTYAQIEIPRSALLAAKRELVLRKVRLWRNINGSTGVQRAPKTWVIYGSNDGVEWTELQRQSDAVTWNDSTINHEVSLPNNVEPFRFIRFEPITSDYAYNWKVGLHELEYFVEEVPHNPGVNLREWLMYKGATVADCVSGEGYNATYGPKHLFDGVKSVSTEPAARANRWLANESNDGDPTAFVTIAAPDSLFGGNVDGLVLRRYRIYRYSSLSDDYAVWRAPAKWIIYGSNDGETWEVVDNHSAATEWQDPGVCFFDYIECEVPASGRKAYRQFKFKPTASRWEWDKHNQSGVSWRYGAMELEYFVEEAAPVVNLRDWLSEKGATVTVTGTGYHNTYGPGNLFDGKGMDGTQNLSLRWLAGQKSLDGVGVTIEIPQSALSAANKNLVLKGIRLWRNINSSDGNTGVKRAPRTWVFYGSNDGVSWTELQRQSTDATWSASIISNEVVLSGNSEPFRFLKFQPLTANYGGDYKVGLQEIEYFVSEVDVCAVVVRGSLGDGVGDVSTGYGRVAGLSSGDSLTVTAASSSYADGVKYEATGYTLETSADGGITWGAATSHSGTSATIAYDGTPTRITWQWLPVAYKLNAHSDEGNETVTVSPASVDGYYAAGTAITVTAAGATSPTVTTFREWDVLPEGAIASGATISFTMPAAPTEVNASFTRPWTYIAPGAIAGYPIYKDYAAVTDGNWLFAMGSLEPNDVSEVKYFSLRDYIEGSGRLDLTTLYSDLETEGTRLYPVRGVMGAVMQREMTYYHSWKDGRPKVTSIVVPADILDVESRAFRACPNLTSVDLNGTLEKWNILESSAVGAFGNCPALTNATLHGATALPHHIFAGSAPEVVFDGNPPATVGTGWANDWSLAVGCPRENVAAWRSDVRFTALANIEDIASKQNYDAMVEHYGKDLIGTWDGKWLFRYGNPSGMVIILR